MLFQISEISRTHVIIVILIYISRCLNMFDRCSQNQPHLKVALFALENWSRVSAILTSWRRRPCGTPYPADSAASSTIRLVPNFPWISHEFVTNLARFLIRFSWFSHTFSWIAHFVLTIKQCLFMGIASPSAPLNPWWLASKDGWFSTEHDQSPNWEPQ